MKNSLFLILFLIGIVFICGCARTTPANNPGPAPDITSPPVTMAATLTLLPATIPAPSKDPIIGSWKCYNYLASGRIEKVWTFMENGTFTMVNTNMKSLHKKYVYGLWTRESASTYQIKVTAGGLDTFTYDSTNDQFSDTYFQDTYTRATGSDTRISGHVTMNMTILRAQTASEINGSHPHPGYKYLVVSISIKNVNETSGYAFTDDRIWVVSDDGQGLIAINQKLNGMFEDPFPSGTIGPGEAQQGNVIFGVPEKSQSYTLKLFDNNGYVISNIPELDNVQVYAGNTTG